MLNVQKSIGEQLTQEVIIPPEAMKGTMQSVEFLSPLPQAAEDAFRRQHSVESDMPAAKTNPIDVPIPETAAAAAPEAELHDMYSQESSEALPEEPSTAAEIFSEQQLHDLIAWGEAAGGMGTAMTPGEFMDAEPVLEPADANLAPVDTVHENSMETEHAESVEVTTEEAAEMWGKELEKEPAEILEDFTDILTLLTEQAAETEPAAEAVSTLSQLLAETSNDPATVPIPAESGILSLETPIENAPESRLIPPIAASLAESLKTLEPEAKAEAAAVVQNIVGAIHGIRILESRQAPAIAIEQIEEQLNELMTQLFEIAGIEYTKEDTERFVRFLLTPEFSLKPPAMNDQEQLDLTKVGTREAKHFSALTFTRPDGEIVTKTLGMLALFYIRALRSSHFLTQLAHAGPEAGQETV